MPTPDITWADPLLLEPHLGLVVTSVGLFSVRELAALQGQGWPLRPGWRRASEGIDTALLAAGAGLSWLLRGNPLHTPWLGITSARVSALFLLAALLCMGFMSPIALARHPLGWWAP